MAAINQKEYLKKYLGLGKSLKRKKKMKSRTVNRVNIIDDDQIQVEEFSTIEEYFNAENEDAPQVVAVIDERPPSMRVDDQTKDNLWIPIGSSVEPQISSEKVEVNTEYASRETSNENSVCKARTDSDNSPVRRKQSSIKKESKNDEMLKKMSIEASGKMATTVFRDKKTGRIRNFAEEAEQKVIKKKKDQENVEKYSRWGKGLKQVEDATSRLADQLVEMSKPLARYADDEDLEKHLKEKERDGDPMLAYFRKKRKKDAIVQGKPVKPVYEGEYLPNRFAIKPGHRWDGVDRSNDYEKKWFEVQNSKQAQLDDYYKWSTEDM